MLLVETIPIEVTERDVNRAVWLSLVRQRFGLRYLPITLIIAALIPFGLAALALSGVPMPKSAYFFAGACALLVVLFPLAVRRQSAGLVARRVGAFTFAFGDSGFYIESEHGKHEAKWDAVRQSLRSRGLHVLFETDDIYHIVPLAGISGDADKKLSLLLRDKVKSRTRTLDLFAWLSPAYLVLFVAFALFAVAFALSS